MENPQSQSVPSQPKMQYRMSESIAKIMPALLAASKEIKHSERNGTNEHLGNSYSTIAAVIDACKSALAAQEIIVLQFPCKTHVTTRLQHTSGEYIESDLELLFNKQDMQGIGSAITYARRQSLTSMLNMAQQDDDGNKASQESKKKTAKTIINSSAKKNDDPFSG